MSVKTGKNFWLLLVLTFCWGVGGFLPVKTMQKACSKYFFFKFDAHFLVFWGILTNIC